MKDLVEVTDIPNIFSEHQSYSVALTAKHDEDNTASEKKITQNKTSKKRSILKSFKSDNLKKREMEENLRVTFDLTGIKIKSFD